MLALTHNKNLLKCIDGHSRDVILAITEIPNGGVLTLIFLFLILVGIKSNLNFCDKLLPPLRKNPLLLTYVNFNFNFLTKNFVFVFKQRSTIYFYHTIKYIKLLQRDPSLHI